MIEHCSICTKKTRCIAGYGPTPSKYMACGEAPGLNEDRTGVPFVGAAGKEFDQTYLYRAGIRRSEVFVTNVRMCRPPQNRKPTREEIEVCGRHHLPEEIQRVSPEIIFLLGATACSLIPSIQLDVEHGIPQWCEDLFGWSGWIVPHYHPALGLHSTGDMIPMLSDWERLRSWLETGEWVWPEDRYPDTDYRLVESRADIYNYFSDYWTGSMLAVDTESHAGEHWSTQASILSGTGVLAPAKSAAIERLNQLISEWPMIILHQCMADLPHIPEPRAYRDTMVECYNLGDQPQGLKELGYRLFGVRMKSWEDTVLPHSKAALTEWMVYQLMAEEEQPIIKRVQLKTKVKEVRQQNPNAKLLQRVIQHTLKGTDYDPWERLEGKFEHFPQKGIAHVPLEESVHYGCRDADISLRLAIELDHLREEAKRGYPTDPNEWDRTETLSHS